jgi:hypothetical protein
MADSTEKSVLEQIAQVFREHGVKFIVIGGQAEALMGSPRVTYDVDLCYQRNAQNLDNLAAALRQLDVKLRGVPENVRFVIDAPRLRHAVIPSPDIGRSSGRSRIIYDHR